MPFRKDFNVPYHIIDLELSSSFILLIAIKGFGKYSKGHILIAAQAKVDNLVHPAVCSLFLHDEGFRTRSGKRVALSMTYRIFKDTFYYGEFEYPVGSGNWYQGKHPKIIDKELWEEANKRLKTFQKSKWGGRTFYYSRLFKCGSCGSGVCGEEHINRHGKKYTYYKCTKYGGKERCSEKYTREENLITSIADLIDQFKTADMRVHKRILREVGKFNAMQKLTLGDDAKLITHKDYIEYILKNGTNIDKRHFLECLEGQLLLEGGSISLAR